MPCQSVKVPSESTKYKMLFLNKLELELCRNHDEKPIRIKIKMSKPKKILYQFHDEFQKTINLI
jgi:hypothetical protein